jgi:uncharacterized 2Fe-2S/4Fe-4S cluster protein (DUF4445 family)
MIRLGIEPHGEQIEAAKGELLLEALRRAGRAPEAPCGGKGRCGKCAVALGPDEDAPAVLACQVRLDRDLTVWVGANTNRPIAHVLTPTAPRPVIPAPNVSKHALTLPAPSLADQRGDLERLASVAGPIDLPAEEMASLSRVLRQDEWRVTATLIGGSVRQVRPGHDSAPPLGLAVDVGTTTVVAYLLDLDAGKVLAVPAAANPQSRHGDDVISRIAYANDVEPGLGELGGLVRTQIEHLLDECCAQAGVSKADVCEVLAVGNTTMLCLLLGVPPRHIAHAPYIPPFTSAQRTRGLWDGVDLVTLPVVSAYVGADTVGVMLAEELDRVDGPTLAIDIGTNGEIVLAAPGRILACSAAAGPAFEGAHISQGMRAASGAIDHVWMEGGDLAVSTIDGGGPVGVCGSGLADAVAVFLEEGAVDDTGRLLTPREAEHAGSRLTERIEQGAAGTRCRISDQVWVTQKDIREVQLAKGAIRAGCEILMREMGIGSSDLAHVVLAGAFGSYLSPYSAVRLGLLPPVGVEIVEPVGNAAGSGAILALLSVAERRRAVEIAERTEHIELSARPEFAAELANAMLFG